MIHVAPNLPLDPAIRSGMRPDSTSAVYLDWHRVLSGGIPIYISNNDVMLTPGTNGILPTKYIWKIVDIPRHLA